MLVVIKVGTNVLTGNTNNIQASRIKEIIGEIFELRKKHKVILVSSGAVGSGRMILPDLDLVQKKQVWAAIGQPVLMQTYRTFADQLDMVVGQCLVLRDDFTNRERYDNFVKTIQGSLAAEVLPIINENDVVAMSDLTVGDNDFLAAMVAVATAADKLIILTNQKGLFTSNPDKDKNAKLISVVNDVDFELEKLCTNEKSDLGRGGMLSKVRAAKHASHAGIETVVADGRDKAILTSVMDKNSIGTRFVSKSSSEMTEQKRWLMSAKGFGQIVIDDGAVKALYAKKSLLLPGIVGIRGLFDKNEIVEVISKKGLAVAYGRTNYNHADIQSALVSRKNSKDSVKSLDKEVIHRDYMAILGKNL